MEMRLFNTLLVCCYFFAVTSGSPVGCDPRYPEVRYTEPRNIRLKNMKTDKYVFMRTEEDGVVFGTKVLTKQNDHEVNFTLHSYATANGQGGVVVLPISSDSRVFSVTDDRHLQVPALDNDLPLDPSDVRTADSSFFHLKRAVDYGEDAIALQAMNGVDCNFYLAVDGDDLSLKEYSGDSRDYPQEIIFLEELTYPSS